ncbi:class I SAM-dependent methyltransferase [Polyangium jinanense]|uniref:Class I SAM-dependent methyltransferase n=1 Tax=Polyangium jinanense TaxID=2829994 RepID=A0A9X3X725_9BACT|nr:class I SAM-dependent methyltransferase [Polyangium jinanense]MDC3957520.1 class I SAM-dependent methyltransferase [Polyangium jinanense]MDC3984989.1 class I SAM-dependent methyltransferase [Polyangium jinanense]
MTYRIPPWIRALLAADRLAHRIATAREGLRDELLLAWIPEADRAALTAALYARQKTYLPGGHRFESGLFTWEKRVLDAPTFPRRGCVLVGAAGAGREVVALLERGYEVTAFDPCEDFVESARTLTRGRSAEILLGSYDDLIAASEGRGGPLASLGDPLSFDAVILGWGSLSHVLPASARLGLLRAVRALAPRAVVLTSFQLRHDSEAKTETKGRLRDALRRAFTAMGAPGRSEPGDQFYPDGGFFSYLSPDEIPRVAFEAGYEVVLFEEGPYPHALLAPLTGAV